MNCKKCNAQLINGATFCGNCGARVDGKTRCYTCGALNEENSKYCIYCGTYIGKETVDTNLAVIKQKPAKNKVKAKKSPIVYKNKYHKTMSLITACIALLSVLVVLGANFFVSTYSEDGIIFRFWEIFDNDIVDGGPKRIKIMYYSYMILRAIVGLEWFAVFIFPILTIIQFIKSLFTKDFQKPVRFSLLTSAIYFLMVASFVALEEVGIGGYFDGEGEFANCRLTSKTCKGLIICALFALLILACNWTSDLTAWKKPSIKTKKISALIIGIITAITLVFTVKTSLTWTFVDKIKDEKIIIEGFPLFSAMSLAILCFDGKWAHIISATGIIGQITLMASIVFLVFGLVRQMRNSTQNEYKSGLKWVILSTIFAVLSFIAIAILGYAADQLIMDCYNNNYYTLTYSLAFPIIVMVFNAILLGVTIAGKVVCKKYQNDEE